MIRGIELMEILEPVEQIEARVKSEGCLGVNTGKLKWDRRAAKSHIEVAVLDVEQMTGFNVELWQKTLAHSFKLAPGGFPFHCFSPMVIGGMFQSFLLGLI